MKLFGISWFSARSFSAMLTIILGLLIYDMSAVKQRNVSPAWPP
jgi:hypothetical protein